MKLLPHELYRLQLPTNHSHTQVRLKELSARVYIPTESNCSLGLYTHIYEEATLAHNSRIEIDRL